MTPTIVAIVEGHSDSAAIEILVRRWFHDQQVFRFQIRPLITNGVGSILVPHDGRTQRGVEYWIRVAQNYRPCAILVLLDADEECGERPRHRPPTAKLGPWLLSRARATAGHIPISVVVADRRFESWFLCPPCQQVLHREGLFQNTDPDITDQATGRSSERLRELMGRAYSNTVDQPRLAACMPLNQEMAHASRSFRKLLQELATLCRIASA